MLDSVDVGRRGDQGAAGAGRAADRDRGRDGRRASRGPGRQPSAVPLPPSITLGATRPTAVNLHWALRRMERRADRAAALGRGAGAGAAGGGAGDLGRGPRDVRADRRAGRPAHARAARPSRRSAMRASLATGGIGTALAPIYHLHRAGRGPAGRGAGDPAAAAGQPAHRLGAEPRRGGVHPDRRRHDRQPAPAGRRRLRAGGRRPDRRQRRRRQQDRDLRTRARGARRTGCRSTSWRRPPPSIPPFPTAPRFPIELRARRRGDRVGAGVRAAADGVAVWNPAFDVTPAELVTAIVTDRGVVPPGQISRLMD